MKVRKKKKTGKRQNSWEYSDGVVFGNILTIVGGDSPGKEPKGEVAVERDARKHVR